MPLLRSCAYAVLAGSCLLVCSSLHAAPSAQLPSAAPPSGIILVDAGGITVHDAWARASAGAASTGAAYVTVMGGTQPDQLIGASTPVAATAEVHQTLDDNGVMKMRATPSLPIPPGQAVTFSPNGTHIMLMGLKQKLVAGQSFPLTLTFAHADPVTVEVKVQPLGHAAAMSGHDMMHMH